MKLKNEDGNSVSLVGIRPELIVGIMVAERVVTAIGREFIITSVSDGKHGFGSLHYIGMAFDFRTRHMTDAEQEIVKNNLKASLTDEWDVVLESTHFHIEFQPK